MKKIFLLLMLPLLALTLNSCSKDDGGDGNGNNEFTINGNTYTLTSGYMEYYGYNNSYNDLQNAASIMIYLGYKNWDEHENAIDNEGATGVEITLNIPKSNTKPVAGTYTFNDSDDKIFICTEGFTDENQDGDDHKFTGGTITVAVSGDTYTIKVDCTLDNGGTVKGMYKGSLAWRDISNAE